MIEVDAVADATRTRRRTWLSGGVLLAVSALLGLGLTSLQSILPGMLFDISQVLFSAGAIVFAIGLGRAGSVTARRPLGTGAIIALAVWQLVMPLVMLPFWSARDARRARDHARPSPAAGRERRLQLGSLTGS